MIDGTQKDFAELYKMIRETQKKAYAILGTEKGMEYREQLDIILENLDSARVCAAYMDDEEHGRR